MTDVKNIALFMDVDNCKLDFVHYENVINQLKECGNIVCATIYGATERKHKKLMDDAQRSGYRIELPAVDKKRGSRVFDDRIFVDVAELVASNSTIDAVAIVAQPTNMVHLYVMLKRHGISIFACDNADEYSMSYVDEFIDTGKVEQLKVPTHHVVAKKKAMPKPETMENMAETVAQETKQDAPALTAIMQAETTATQIAEQPNIADETQALLDKISNYRTEEQPSQEPAEPQENVKVVSQSDNDLLRQIEQAKQTSDDDADLIARIQELLADLKK